MNGWRAAIDSALDSAEKEEKEAAAAAAAGEEEDDKEEAEDIPRLPLLLLNAISSSSSMGTMTPVWSDEGALLRYPSPAVPPRRRAGLRCVCVVPGIDESIPPPVPATPPPALPLLVPRS